MPAQLAGAAVIPSNPGNILPAQHEVHLDDAILEFGFDVIARLRDLHIAVPAHVAEVFAGRSSDHGRVTAFDPAGQIFEIPDPAATSGAGAGGGRGDGGLAGRSRAACPCADGAPASGRRRCRRVRRRGPGAPRPGRHRSRWPGRARGGNVGGVAPRSIDHDLPSVVIHIAVRWRLRHPAAPPRSAIALDRYSGR